MFFEDIQLLPLVRCYSSSEWICQQEPISDDRDRDLHVKKLKREIPRETRLGSMNYPIYTLVSLPCRGVDYPAFYMTQHTPLIHTSECLSVTHTVTYNVNLTAFLNQCASAQH